MKLTFLHFTLSLIQSAAAERDLLKVLHFLITQSFDDTIAVQVGLKCLFQYRIFRQHVLSQNWYDQITIGRVPLKKSQPYRIGTTHLVDKSCLNRRKREISGSCCKEYFWRCKSRVGHSQLNARVQLFRGALPLYKVGCRALSSLQRERKASRQSRAGRFIFTSLV